MNITVNGRPHEAGPASTISHEDLVDLVRGRGTDRSGYRVTFFTRRSGYEQAAGSLLPGDSLPLEPGIVFTVEPRA